MLSDVAPGRAADEIQQRASSPVPSVRATAMANAASLPSYTAQPLLLAALRDNDATVASTAVDGLASIGGREAETAIAAILTSEDTDPRVRTVAAMRLAVLGGEAARAHAELIGRFTHPADEQ